jgi:hypothetical protein
LGLFGNLQGDELLPLLRQHSNSSPIPSGLMHQHRLAQRAFSSAIRFGHARAKPIDWSLAVDLHTNTLTRSTTMRFSWRDVPYGWRMLRRSPGFAALAILTSAIGIAANTTVFSWIDAVLLRPLPGTQGRGFLACLLWCFLFFDEVWAEFFVEVFANPCWAAKMLAIASTIPNILLDISFFPVT